MNFIKRLLAVLIITIAIPFAAVAALFLAITAGLAFLVFVLVLSTKSKGAVEGFLEQLQEEMKGDK